LRERLYLGSGDLGLIIVISHLLATTKNTITHSSFRKKYNKCKNINPGSLEKQACGDISAKLLLVHFTTLQK